MSRDSPADEDPIDGDEGATQPGDEVVDDGSDTDRTSERRETDRTSDQRETDRTSDRWETDRPSDRHTTNRTSDRHATERTTGRTTDRTASNRGTMTHQPPRAEPRAVEPTAADTSGTLVNALVGAVVTVVTVFIVPLSPVLGGAVAGYMQGGDNDDGLKVGALSGVIALVPVLLLAPLTLFFFVIEPIFALVMLVLALFSVTFLVAYTVGLSALGGIVGVYLKDEL